MSASFEFECCPVPDPTDVEIGTNELHKLSVTDPLYIALSGGSVSEMDKVCKYYMQCKQKALQSRKDDISMREFVAASDCPREEAHIMEHKLRVAWDWGMDQRTAKRNALFLARLKNL